MRFATVLAAIVFCCVVTAAPVFAVGDANEVRCPATTESSPGFRAVLPDCRAYEIVNESNSGDTANVVGSYGFPEGLHVYYKSFLPTPAIGAGSGLQERFLATRTASGWIHQAISPPQGEGPAQLESGARENAEGVIFTGSFSEAFVNSPFQDPFEDPHLNHTLGMGVYRLSLGGGAAATLSIPDSGELTQATLEGSKAYAGFAETNDWGAFLTGGAADGSKAFFVTTAKLVTAAGTPPDTHEASNEIYEHAGGHTYLIGVLPDGSVPVCGAEVSQAVGSTLGRRLFAYGAVAPNGTNVVFSSPGREPLGAKKPCNEGGLFLRNVVDSTTVQLSGSLFGGRAGTSTGEEEKVFTLGGGIHEYHVSTGRTTEIGENAAALLTYSHDGAHVYYLGPEEGIYVFEEGKSPMLIPGTEAGGYTFNEAAAKGGGEISAGGPTDYGVTRNMPVTTPDGSDLLFIDTAKLSAYKNEGHHEAYVYDARTNKVTCVSCSPANASPQGQAQLIDEFTIDTGEQQYQNPSPPFISNNGSRAVFETTEALMPQDVNGTDDVYEWERLGTNGCTKASTAYSTVIDGCVYMLSSGLGEEVPNENGIVDGTHLVGASENLRDVYVQTSEPLLPGLDNASKLYDVRIDGGFPYTSASRSCEAEECAAAGGEPTPLGESTTEVFAGAGNATNRVAHRSVRPSAAKRRRRLAHALKVCRRIKHKRRRLHCERVARRRYGDRVAGRHVGAGGR